MTKIGKFSLHAWFTNDFYQGKARKHFAMQQHLLQVSTKHNFKTGSMTHSQRLRNIK